jgi:hypothetical protein
MLQWAETSVALPAGIRAQVEAGQTLTLGVRPEEAQVVKGDRPMKDGMRLRGTVETVEPDFSRGTQMAYLRTGPFFYAARGTLDVTLNVGDEVEVVYPVDRLYFFGGPDERRVEG